ncbi:sigmaA [Reptilian orthoreovirus]|uniref:SigmaA n=1 Tax=Reptilian orthoreovirus TaxID=226613 RepID=W8P904_9REOV|nr:sigmaA [Reptilian orthoreovirus]AHL26967.1 sigmaA [Reptilian orthoreovirus]
MARVVYPYFTTPWNDRTVPLTQKQLYNLLTSSNALWQMQNLTSFIPSVQTQVSTPLLPVPGSAWYQVSLIYSAFINIAVGPPNNWRDHYFRDTVWTGPDLESVVQKPNAPAYVEQNPQPAVFLDMLRSMTWANQRFPMYRIYAQTYRLSLLNASLHGPIFWVETGPNFISATDATWLSSMIGRDMREISFRLVQSTVNMPFAADDHYDTSLRALIAVFILSYLGVINQNSTLRGYYFATKERGTGLETWTLEENLHGARVNILAAHRGYFGVKSPDWNVDPAILALAALSSIRQSIRAVAPIRNATVIQQAQNRPGFTERNGVPVLYFTLLTASEFCLNQWLLANLISPLQRQEMQRKTQAYFQAQEMRVDAILAEDDDRMRANPALGRRIKPYPPVDWLPGNSRAALNALAAYVG